MPLAAPRVVVVAAVSAAALLVNVASDTADPADVLSTMELLATGVSALTLVISVPRSQPSRPPRAGVHSPVGAVAPRSLMMRTSATASWRIRSVTTATMPNARAPPRPATTWGP